jgi:hypothetical protein
MDNKTRCAFYRDIADRSTGPGPYYETRGHAVAAFSDVLGQYGYTFDEMDPPQLPGDNGARAYPYFDETNTLAGYIYLAWYRMPSGRYEVIGYIT